MFDLILYEARNYAIFNLLFRFKDGRKTSTKGKKTQKNPNNPYTNNEGETKLIRNEASAAAAKGEDQQTTLDIRRKYNSYRAKL